MPVDVEEVETAEVGVTVHVPRVDARGEELRFDVRLLGILCDEDGAAHLGEGTADLGDHEVSRDKLD